MIKLIKKEIHNHIYLSSFSIYLLLLIILFGINIYILKIDYLQRLSDYNHAKNSYNEWAKNYASPSALKQFTLLYPDPITIFFQGSKYLINIDNEKKILFSPIEILFKNLDFGKATMILLSLIVIIYCYNSINGEKQDGTLKLLRAGGLSKYQIFLGKYIGNVISIFIPYLIVIIFCIIYILVDPLIYFSSLNWLEIFIFLLGVLLFISALIFGCLWVSACAKDTITSLIILLCFWIFFVFIIPNITQYISTYFVKVPNKIEIDRNIKHIDQEKKNNINSLLMEYLANNPDTNIEEWIITNPEVMKIIYKAETSKKEIKESYYKKLVKQIKFAISISKISPSQPLFNIIQSISHNRADEITGYFKAVCDNSYDLFKVQLKMIEEDSKAGRSFHEQRDVSERLPEFKYKYASFLEIMNESILDLGLLVLWSISFFICGYFKWINKED